VLHPQISSTERLARQRRNNQLRNLEKDSERWFQEQVRGTFPRR
jgi:hypothetical protein